MSEAGEIIVNWLDGLGYKTVHWWDNGDISQIDINLVHGSHTKYLCEAILEGQKLSIRLPDSTCIITLLPKNNVFDLADEESIANAEGLLIKIRDAIVAQASIWTERQNDRI